MHISIFEHLFFEKITRQMLVIFSSSSLSHVDAITWFVVLLLDGLLAVQANYHERL
jgi:ABC-type Na+ transport system ATPase subunit NatA